MEVQSTEQAPVAAPSAPAAAPAVDNVVLPPLSAHSSAEDLDAAYEASLAPPAEVKAETPKSEEPKAAKPEVTPEVTEPPTLDEPPVEKPAEEQPVEEAPSHEEAEQPEPEKPAKVLPGRINTHQFSEIEQEAIALGKSLKEAGEDVPSLKERIELVETRRAKESQADSLPVEPSKPPEPSEVDRLTSELAEIDSQIEEAGKKESLFTPELSKAVRAQAALTAQLALAKERQANAEAANLQSFNAERETARQKAVEMFPEAAIKNSDLRQRVDQRIRELKNPKHPDHETLFPAKSPLSITRDVAMELAQERAVAKGTSLAVELAALMPATTATPAKAAAAPKPATPQTKKVQPASGSATPVPQPPAPNGSDLLKKPFDPKAYDSALGYDKEELVMAGR